MAESRPAVRRWAFPALLLTLAGMLAAWYFLALEWEEYEVDLGYGPEARRNPYLAAQQLLEARHHPVLTLTTFAPLQDMGYKDTPLGPDDLVILINARGVLQGMRLENLWQWVERGGHLVMSGRNSFVDSAAGGEDPLLERLGIRLVDDLGRSQADPSGDGGFAALYGPTNVDCSQLSGSPVQPRAGPEFQLARMPAPAFEDLRGRPLLWRDGAQPPRHLRFRQGAGTVTLNADNRIWDNSRIGCFDHAYALALLAVDRPRVWILVNEDAPSLWKVLWRSAPVAVSSFGLALLLWLWARGKRFAPAVPRIVTGRRSFLEHLHASGVFLWRHRQGGRLVEETRRDLFQRLGRRYPGFAEREAREQIALVREVSGLSLTDIEKALHGPLPATPADFTLIVSRLQHIRNRL